MIFFHFILHTAGNDLKALFKKCYSCKFEQQYFKNAKINFTQS